MVGYRKTASLSSVDTGYVAGMIDGEGTVTLARKHAGENRQLLVSISSTEDYVLKFLLHRIGAGKITRKRASKQEHAPGFAYAIWNRQALKLLEQTTPYLRTYKRDRALCILENYVRLTPRNGKYSDQLAAERTRFEEHVLAMKPGR